MFDEAWNGGTFLDPLRSGNMSGMNRHGCYVTLVNLGVKVNDASTACHQLA
ncbi:hypothetical protein [Streptomyces virginiae]|uniref:hypothetical protein n=1 Tax=Streptomyces virginiae TaxID=1961 RepID=UPI0036FA85EF